MKPYEGCAVCVVNELRKDCTDMCVFTMASKEDLISRLSDNVHYTPYEHNCIREALLDSYYLKQFETNNEGDDVQMHIDNMIKMNDNKRISKVDYYLGIADTVSKRGTCLRRNYGSVIVKDDHIVSTGYNGAPRGRVNCCDRGECWRKSHNIPQYADYSKCRSCHAEMNAIINASPEEMRDSELYLVGRNYDDGTLTDADCCTLCKRMVINAGIKRVIVRLANGASKCIDVNDWIENDDTLNVD